MNRRHSWPGDHWAWPIPLTHKHGVRCGDMIFVGGQVDLDDRGQVRHPNDLPAQVRAAMGYLDRVLRDLEAGFDDLVKLVVYYRPDGADAEGALLSQIAGFLTALPGPAVTAVPLPALAYPGLMVEIEAVAMAAAGGTDLPRRAAEVQGYQPLPAAFSQALKCGEMIFASAQMPLAEDGSPLAPGDVVVQSRVSMERLGELLNRLGADFEDVVKVNVFYVGAGTAETWAEPAKVRAGYFPEPGPAATGVPLPRLLPDGLMTKVEVTAMRALDGSRLAKRFSWPEGHWDWTTHLPYRHGNRCGKLLHLGGQVSLDSQGGVIDPGDMAAQTRRAMDNIDRVLAGLGASLDDVVKVTAFYQGAASADALHDNLRIRSGCFTAPGPASTGVPVPYLAYQDMVIEIEVIAMTD